MAPKHLRLWRDGLLGALAGALTGALAVPAAILHYVHGEGGLMALAAFFFGGIGLVTGVFAGAAIAIGLSRLLARQGSRSARAAPAARRIGWQHALPLAIVAGAIAGLLAAVP